MAASSSADARRRTEAGCGAQPPKTPERRLSRSAATAKEQYYITAFMQEGAHVRMSGRPLFRRFTVRACVRGGRCRSAAPQCPPDAIPRRRQIAANPMQDPHIEAVFQHWMMVGCADRSAWFFYLCSVLFFA